MMKKPNLIVLVCGLFIGALASHTQAVWTWELLVAPNDVPAACAYDVSGTRIVGFYHDGPRHGFVYDIATGTATTMDIPEAHETELWAIDGDRIAGCGYEYLSKHPLGFLHDGAGWSRSDLFTGISGDRMVATFTDFNLVNRGLLYGDTGWPIVFDYPGASGTSAFDIDGANIVGAYTDSSNLQHGYLYDAAAGAWQALDFPGAIETVATGISGNRIVGWYKSGTGIHGFLHDGINWESLDYPGGANTRPYGICGDYIVGTTFVPMGGPAQMPAAFLLTVPEPATLALLALGGLLAGRRRMVSDEPTGTRTAGGCCA